MSYCQGCADLLRELTEARSRLLAVEQERDKALAAADLAFKFQLQEEAEAEFALAELAALRARMRAMEGYVQHKAECATRNKISHDPKCLIDFAPPNAECTCGLTALLDLPVSETEQKNDDDQARVDEEC